MITTHEEFLQSLRDNNFNGKWTDEQEAWWHKQNAQQALEQSAAYSKEIRAGFPPSLAAQRVIEGQRRFL